MKTRYLAFLGLLTILLAQPVFAAQEVGVGLYMLNLGRFDVATGTFTADFYLSLKCPVNCTGVQYEFVNGRASTTDVLLDTAHEKFYRVQANLYSPVRLQEFPFDSQEIRVLIEDRKQTTDTLTFTPLTAESGIDPSIPFVGWNLNGWNATVAEHIYTPYSETYSQYAFTISISRISLNSFMKTILPVIFMLIVVLCSFLIDPDKISTRLGTAGSSLVAAVMFHVSISNQIPPVGYLTFADKFMLLTYMVLLASFIMSIILLELIEQKKNELAETIHRRTEYAVFIIVPLLYAVLWFFF